MRLWFVCCLLVCLWLACCLPSLFTHALQLPVCLRVSLSPQVVPALDPATPIYASSFVMKLIKRRMEEYSLYNPERFRTFEMKSPFSAGPFQ